MRKILSKILFVFGFIIVIFPFALRFISYINQTNIVDEYNVNFNNMSEDEKRKQQEKSDIFNETLIDSSSIINIEEIEDSVSEYSFKKKSEVIGALIIPKINIKLPMYEGTEGDNLQNGVVLLKETSYPTAKESTHSVIAGHSGLTGSKILDDIDELVIGDSFFIEYLGSTNCYKVIDIKVVLPNQTESLKIQKNKTLVTLVTCTPKNVNTHRLLVTGELTQMPDNGDENEVTTIKNNYIIIFGVIISLILIISCIIYMIRKINKKNNNTNGGEKNGK